MINWTASKEEMELILKIADRAVEMIGDRKETQGVIIDIEATHCNGCPIDLERLLNAPDYDFAHDVDGIRTHLNRRTGELEDCFLPRYAKPEAKA